MSASYSIITYEFICNPIFIDIYWSANSIPDEGNGQDSRDIAALVKSSGDSAGDTKDARDITLTVWRSEKIAEQISIVHTTYI